MDDVDLAGEPARDRVAHDRVTEGSRRGDPDDRDRPRGEHPLDRAGLGPLLPRGQHPVVLAGRLDVDDEAEHAVVQGRLRPVPGLLEHGEHPLVLGQHVGDEPLDAALTGCGGQVLEQDRAETTPLVLVADREGDLGLQRRGALVDGDADDLAADGRHHRDPVDVVDVDRALDVGLAQHEVRHEVAEVERPVGQPTEEGAERLGVVGADRAQVSGRPVEQDDVGLPVRRVCPLHGAEAIGGMPQLRHRAPCPPARIGPPGGASAGCGR